MFKKLKERINNSVSSNVDKFIDNLFKKLKEEETELIITIKLKKEEKNEAS
jgi:phosphoribosyl-ATP pyrophosphohydrolase